MTEKKSLFHPYTVDNIHPGFSVDCVILSYYKKKIRILLNKFDFSLYWQLPGGFMFKTESADEAAIRMLSSRTGLENVYLKQFHLFSDPNRTKMDQNVEYIEQNVDKGRNVENVDQWFLQRFITLGYYAFVKYEDVRLASIKEDTTKWFDVENLPPLYSDHNNIIKTAQKTIIAQLPLIPVGYQLLPDKFMMSDLRRIYEIILEKTLDRRNFQRKALSTGLLIQLEETGNTSSYNPPILYSFNKSKMEQADFQQFYK